MFYRFAPGNRTSDLHVNEYGLPLDRFAKRLRAQGPQHGATLGADHLVWGGPLRNSHARILPDKRALAREVLPDFFSAPG
jgi:hypothetical protein